MKNNTVKELNNQKALMQERRLHAICSDAIEVMDRYHTSQKGLTMQQVLDNQEQYGMNVISSQSQVSLVKQLIAAFINPFTLILITLVIVSTITDIILPIFNHQPDDVSIVTVVIIVTMVMISGILRYVQESKSEKATEKLLDMITTTTSVRRYKHPDQEVPLDEIVVGDIIQLAAGDMIPADLRLIQGKDLFVSQSSLTGESIPVEKISVSIPDYDDALLHAPNMLFMGSNVISGAATAVVIATGNETMIGMMAQSMNQQVSSSSFEKGIRSVSMVLIRFMLMMVPIVLFVNGFTKGNWTEALLFAISIAVGLTPEMLPMIVTTSLAKGAVEMSKQKTIIKNLNAIQDFGAMDVLCTDKTGTLTQDKVILEYHLNVLGETDARVLRHAFLNSYFQTGLKNLLDLAIIECLKETDQDVWERTTDYTKVDEIPFDFNRRRMSVVVEDKGQKRQMITKGAIEEILSICEYVEYGDEVLSLTQERKKEILQHVDTLNQTGMRVLGVAQKTNPSQVGTFSVEDESMMVLIGYLAFLDPPKETTKQAILTLKEYGVSTKILTGDNEKITKYICQQVGIEVEGVLLGETIEKMDDDMLKAEVECNNIFAKLSPDQKERIIIMLKSNGHVVGYMGDGINDASAMKASDIGISVDTAVDIAKESADVILLEKDLMVLETGIVEGRKTYGNMIKYIKMTASSNFGNMFSVLIASAFLPFLPMMSIHLILLNLIYDLTCSAIPWDHVDEDFVKVPRQWDASSIGRFMLFIGPTSSVFDIVTYGVMYFIICPAVVSNGVLFHHLAATDVATKALYIAVFQAGWFVESMWTQTLVIHMIRTPKIPFIQSRASKRVTLLTFIGIAFITWIPFSPFASSIGLAPLPLVFFAWLFGIVLGYMILVNVVKFWYIKRFKQFL